MFKKKILKPKQIDMLFPAHKENWKQDILDTKAANSWKNQQFIPLLTAVEMTCYLKESYYRVTDD